MTLVGALTTICNLKAFRQKQIQLHSYRCRDKQKNRTIRIITIKIVFHHGKLVVAAAAAKSLQSCPTLCNPMDCSLPGSSVHVIFQARTLEWGASAFSRENSMKIPWLRTLYSILKANGTPIQYSCLENPMDGGAW